MTDRPTTSGAASPPFRCATAARARGDAISGTAAPAYRWLLIEHPGPWHPEALQGRGIRADDAAAVAAAATTWRARVVLVRRPGRQPAAARGPEAERSWTVVDSRSGRQLGGTWTERRGLAAAAAALGAADDEWEPATTRLLVCTHGMHDACCAVRGRPVAAGLAQRWPEQVWECSHLGGDRFAATMVVLPDGACYGGLDARTADEVVAGHLTGRVVAEYLRGLATQSAPMQAAVVHALREHGPAPIEAVRPVALERAGVESWIATLAGSAPLPPRLVLQVRLTWDEPAQLTCRAAGQSAPLRYQVQAAASRGG
ncbi:MAG TPA: sucrase ferredoxin [Dermatophilaceae bacterium]|nr:sucrase ferredoxin [Dermatophilaceae bacterium]